MCKKLTDMRAPPKYVKMILGAAAGLGWVGGDYG